MEMDNYVFNHLPVEGVTSIVTDYVYTLFEFVTKYYTKYYKEDFKGSEEQHIDYSFFKVLNLCNSQ